MCHRSISIPTTTRNRARLDPCRAVHPPANRVRPAQPRPRPLYPATNQAARAMRKADYARKQVVCALARPTEHPRAPTIRVQKDQASDSTSTAATSDTPRKRDAATEPDRPHLRAIDQPQLPLHAPARECGKCSAPCSSSRTILLHPSRPNAMLSRRRTTAVVSADW